MSGANLLYIGDPKTFVFEHMMAHRNYFAVMSPLTRFSVLPYLLDPMPVSVPIAGDWMLDHQQAHNDALNHVPVHFGVATVGLAVGQILMDTDLNNASQRAWWTFQNHMEHYIANSTVLPHAFVPTGVEWVYPFW